jgi:hypothetical protein
MQRILRGSVWFALGLLVLAFAHAGCDESASGSNGVVSIIYAVGDVILAILNVVLSG